MPETLSKRTAFEGRVFAVTVERVRLDRGLEVELAVVRHRASVVLVPMPDARSVVLVRQYRHPTGRWLWEVPAGTLEAGEDPDRAARRECEEETGYAPARMERLGAFFAAPGYCDEEMIFYRLSELSRPAMPAAPDEDEELDARVFSLDQARAMVRDGEIVDMKSALALALVGG
jgi:ADP-ribose pyrophosphatase